MIAQRMDAFLPRNIAAPMHEIDSGRFDGMKKRAGDGMKERAGGVMKERAGDGMKERAGDIDNLQPGPSS